ncbi:hypothetical protein GOB93_12005 [Acetobacter musti]|uniref:Uncharacterized protein n=1 Tax=Acetobacter musti TaxID=864732 RepID=A0ABX0JPI3_9PROT|nr:hypothetical protein [Acetobacter musti]NHN85358.1 hypothetical protein [Acetobacter musti]
MSPSDDSFRSHYSAELSDGRSARPRLASIIRLGIWSVLYFLFYLAQQIAELLAPLVLILGIGWAALPHVLGAVSSGAGSVDAQARDVMSHVADAVPHQILVGSHLLTPSGLIFDGVMLMAVAALGATLSAVAARSM